MNNIKYFLNKVIPYKLHHLIRKTIDIIFYPYFLFIYYYTHLEYIDSIKGKKIIIKCDDLCGMTKKVIKLDKMIKKYKIKLSWGVIGYSLEQPSNNYLKFLLTPENTYHFFNHGYYHNVGPNNYEFDGPGEIKQYQLILKTNMLYNKYTKKILNTFGAPCNHIDDNTNLALSRIPDIKFWYYGKDNESNTNLIRSLNIETDIGCPNFKFFIEQVRNAKIINNPLILQCHPNAFEKKHFLELKLIIRFLLKNNCKFITPDDLI